MGDSGILVTPLLIMRETLHLLSNLGGWFLGALYIRGGSADWIAWRDLNVQMEIPGEDLGITLDSFSAKYLTERAASLHSEMTPQQGFVVVTVVPRDVSEDYNPLWDALGGVAMRVASSRSPVNDSYLVRLDVRFGFVRKSGNG